eukprot:TRINITY_DN18379_c0_g1_i1.p1 TRINITY_DN18379_c0_g1~~TRINITY_DN18379_c0_g1_i1.p1  ORF type:complete len:447 (-),score=135.23 TRINITY_DN18379_c0_g1_i1:142-1428(-)
MNVAGYVVDERFVVDDAPDPFDPPAGAAAASRGDGEDGGGNDSGAPSYSSMQHKPRIREQCEIKRAAGEPPEGELFPFSILTYNVLAEAYASYQMHCARGHLLWQYRKPRILYEMQNYASDILCVQELDHYRDIISRLRKFGYKGVFLQRPQSHPDGCAVFFRKSRFALVNVEKVFFDHLTEDKLVKQRRIEGRVHTNNVALLVVLRDLRANGATLLVVCAHLFWHPDFNDVKVLQTRFLLKQIQKSSKRNNVTATVFCGDLNSTPQSAVYQLINNGTLSSAHPDIKKFGLPAFSHQLKLASIYQRAKPKEPLTNLTPKFCGCLDYVWYTHEQLYPLSYLQPLQQTDKDLRDSRGYLPNRRYGSDHFCVGGVLAYQPGAVPPEPGPPILLPAPGQKVEMEVEAEEQLEEQPAAGAVAAAPTVVTVAAQ